MKLQSKFMHLELAFLSWAGLRWALGMLEIMVPCMLGGHNFVKVHDYYVQLVFGIKHDCCFHVCVCRIML